MSEVNTSQICAYILSLTTILYLLWAETSVRVATAAADSGLHSCALVAHVYKGRSNAVCSLVHFISLGTY